ncbi:hypothetical protein CerSpe_169070 [Prunus speciosa]
MRATSESAEWIFLATNLGLEILSAACDQASSPRRPHYALFGMLLAIAAVLISIWELIYRGKKARVVLKRWGMLWWFYHPPPPRHTPFGGSKLCNNRMNANTTDNKDSWENSSSTKETLRHAITADLPFLYDQEVQVPI